MDLPVIETPVFPRWVWMEEITFSHIPIATIITAFMILAPIYEYVGYRRNDLRYDRLARGLIWFALILFSPGAALGTGIVVFIIGAYPEFWSRWSNLFFWPLYAQFVFFLLEVAFLFFGYYLAWDALMHRKRLHIFFGAMAALWGLMVQFVWDALGSYMSTPGGVALPGVNEPVAWNAQAFFNPSFGALTSHRFFGNISYTMLLVGGVFALRYMRQKDPDNKAYFGWAADLTFTIGYLAFFAQPLLGWAMARILGQHAPPIFHSIMGGHTAPHFTIKMGLILTLLLLGGLYLFARHRGRVLRAAMTLGLASLLIVVWAHPPLRWLSSAVAWRIVSSAVVVALIALVWAARNRANLQHKRWQWAMFVAGLAASFTFLLGGFVRERSRNPYTVYGEIVKPEVTPAEADRYLAYQACVGCHAERTMLDSPDHLRRHAGADWAAVVAEHRRQGRVTLEDEQARRIVDYLRENF